METLRGRTLEIMVCYLRYHYLTLISPTAVAGNRYAHNYFVENVTTYYKAISWVNI